MFHFLSFDHRLSISSGNSLSSTLLRSNVRLNNKLHSNKEILYATTSSYFQTMQRKDKKKKKKKTERTTKYLRTIEGKWNLKGRYQFWSHFPGDQSVLFTSFPFLLFIVSRKETLPSRKEKKKKGRKKKGEREREREKEDTYPSISICRSHVSF